MTLEGRHLLVGADIWVPWVDLHQKEDGILSSSGVAASFFDIISSQLNFTYTLKMPADREWGRGMPNGSFTGMIGMCQRKEVDMALGPFGVTYERAKVADFSIPLYVDQFGIFLPRPRLESDISNLTRPLAWKVWVALAFTVLISLLLGTLMNCVLTKSQKGLGPPIDFSWIVKAILREPVASLPTQNTGRIFLTSWLVGGLILSTAYSGVLTSLLAVPKVTVPVDSLEDLVDHGKIPWANERGTSLHQLFSEATSGLYKMISDGGSLVTNAYDARSRIKNERMAVLCDIFTMKKIMSDDFGSTETCNYYIAEEAIKSVSLAFAFPKGSELIQHFDKWLGPLKESGLVSRSVSELTANATACLVKPGKERTNVPLVLSLEDLAGLFLLAGAGSLLGIIFLLMELATSWLQNFKRK